MVRHWAMLMIAKRKRTLVNCPSAGRAWGWWWRRLRDFVGSFAALAPCPTLYFSSFVPLPLTARVLYCGPSFLFYFDKSQSRTDVAAIAVWCHVEQRCQWMRRNDFSSWVSSYLGLPSLSHTWMSSYSVRRCGTRTLDYVPFATVLLAAPVDNTTCATSALLSLSLYSHCFIDSRHPSLRLLLCVGAPPDKSLAPTSTRQP